MTAERLFLIVALCFSVMRVEGYEQASHALITSSAFLASDLAPAPSGISSSLVKSLGLDGFSLFGDGTTYFEFVGDISGVTAYGRTAQNYEKKILKALDTRAVDNLTAIWLMYGAIREDENPRESPTTPQDGEGGNSRPSHHVCQP